MTPILFAFLAIMAPAAVVLGGLLIIKRMARWREARTKRAQDMEFAAHEAKLTRMNQIADRAAGMKRSAQPSSLRVVPRPKPPASNFQDKPAVRVAPQPVSASDPYPGSAAANPFGYGMPTFDSPAPVAASYQGNGGSFDGGGASADWSSSDSCSSSDSSSSSASGSCGSGD